MQSKKAIFAAFILSALILSVSFASAFTTLKAIPQHSVWYADGVTSHRVTIFGNSTDFPSFKIRGINALYSLPLPTGYSYRVIGFSAPAHDSIDFFQDRTTTESASATSFNRMISSNNSSALVSNTQGDILYIDFVLNATINATLNSTRQLVFNQSQTYFYNATVTISPTITSQSFLVMNPAQMPGCGDADFNNDGDSGTDQDVDDFFSVISFGQCSTNNCDTVDINHNGVVNSADETSFWSILAGNSC